MADSTQVGFLVPLNENLERNSTVPRLAILEGANSVGRNSIAVTDKRLSRNHVSVIASADGSAEVVVEGTNPVIVRSLNQRKKLLSREKTGIRDGDIIELIPGHHFFKYEVLDGTRSKSSPKAQKKSSNGSSKITEDETLAQKRAQKRTLNDKGKITEDESLTQKRARQISEDEAFARKLQEEENGSGPVAKSSSEPICGFSLPEDKLSLSFRLLRVKGLPPWANTNAVSIGDVIQGEVLVAILSNYMVDMDWLFSACPALKRVPHVLVIHGEQGGTLEYMKKSKPANWILHRPPLPISYGTHHSKAMFLIYPRGVRIIVHTANLIHVDWNNKTQGLWMQDFPWKDHSDSSKGCGFETDLIDYLTALKWPEFSVHLPEIGNVNMNPSFFKKFNYSSAMVRLIASVPGYHSGPNLKKWGHMKLRTILQDCVFDKEFQKAPLIYQFSSLGSLDEKWMAELTSSMSSGVTDDKKPLGTGEPLIIWPTVEDVRCSLEGYASGNAVPSPLKNVEKDFLKKYWAKWKASHSGRCRAMPHIKTFTRYNGQNLAWFLLTSSNLSKAAWGALQKNNSQLMIRSYELGVLFLPSTITPGHTFSCTEIRNSSKFQGNCGSSKDSDVKRTKLVTLASHENNSGSYQVITLPVPYELPPSRYSPEDVPWSWDRQYNKKDVHGQVWPRQVQLYTNQD